jgi:bifunctional DNA-binding transcriptional regulator/antitoxin component of YhaV-PrlF toxin-antitoxin module
MLTSIVTVEGWVNLPQEILDHLHLKGGNHVEFLINADGKVEMRPAPGSIKDTFGLLHRPGMPILSAEEIDEAIGRYLAEDNERIQKSR